MHMPTHTHIQTRTHIHPISSLSPYPEWCYIVLQGFYILKNPIIVYTKIVKSMFILYDYFLINFSALGDSPIKKWKIIT